MTEEAAMNEDEITPEQKDLYKQLRSAILHGDMEKVKSLTENMDESALNLPLCGGRKDTPLIVAVRGGNVEILNYLLERGADVNAQSGSGESVFDALPYGEDLALKRNQLGRRLIEAGAYDASGEFSGKTDLMFAIEAGDVKEVQRLIANGADINAKNGEGDPVWVYALRRGDTQLLQDLVNAGMDLNTPNQYGRNALMDALYEKDKAAANLLLDANADVNYQAHGEFLEGCTPLFFTNDPELIKRMVDMGADVNHQAQDGSYATEGKSAESLQIMLDAGADIHIVNIVGMNHMTQSALGGDIRKIEILQRAGLDINAADANGWTPLMYAVATKGQVGDLRQEPPIIVKKDNPSAEFVQELINHGAKVTPEVLALVQDPEIKSILANASDRDSLKSDLKKQGQVAQYFQSKKVNEATAANLVPEEAFVSKSIDVNLALISQKTEQRS